MFGVCPGIDCLAILIGYAPGATAKRCRGGNCPTEKSDAAGCRCDPAVVAKVTRMSDRSGAASRTTTRCSNWSGMPSLC